MIKKILILLTIAAALSFLINYFFLSREPKSLLSPNGVVEQNSKQEITPAVALKTTFQDQDALLKEIKDIFFEKNPDIDYGLAIYDLKRNTLLSYNDQEAQHAASVSKVLTAVYLFKKAEDGEIDLNDKMGAFNIEFNVKQMVNQSNNISWDMIDSLLGLTPQNEFAHANGLTSVNLFDNEMSPKDAAMLFVKLYKGELLTEPYQKKLFSYMQNTETEYLIPPAIPKNVPIYHKTGLYEGEIHDVAIIDHPQNPFVLAIFTVDKLNPNYEGRGAIIQKVAAQTYSYFDNFAQ